MILRSGQQKENLVLDVKILDVSEELYGYFHVEYIIYFSPFFYKDGQLTLR